MIWRRLGEYRRMALGQLRPSSTERSVDPGSGPADDEVRLAAVGATPVVIAICRAAETHRDEPWFVDPLGAHVASIAEPTRDTTPRPGLIFWVAVRTRFLDELVLGAVREGVRQVVLLGAGLDARAFRLPVPDDTTFFEVDRSSVHELKSRLVKQARLTARCERRVVVADVTSSDWLAELRAQGWTSDAPTCWLAEGLLVYLTPEPRDALLRELAASSARGSRLGVTATGWADAAQRLETLGWSAEVSTLPQLATTFGRPMSDETEQAQSAILIDARQAARAMEGSGG